MGYAQRNFLAPVPNVANWEELNRHFHQLEEVLRSGESKMFTVTAFSAESTPLLGRPSFSVIVPYTLGEQTLTLWQVAIPGDHQTSLGACTRGAKRRSGRGAATARCGRPKRLLGFCVGGFSDNPSAEMNRLPALLVTLALVSWVPTASGR